MQAVILSHRIIHQTFNFVIGAILTKTSYRLRKTNSYNYNTIYEVQDGAAVSRRRRGSSAEIVRSFSFCVYF